MQRRRRRTTLEVSMILEGWSRAFRFARGADHEKADICTAYSRYAGPGPFWYACMSRKINIQRPHTGKPAGFKDSIRGPLAPRRGGHGTGIRPRTPFAPSLTSWVAPSRGWGSLGAAARRRWRARGWRHGNAGDHGISSLTRHSALRCRRPCSCCCHGQADPLVPG